MRITRLRSIYFWIMNNVNSEGLGRVVASAIASYLQPNSQRKRKTEGNSTVDDGRKTPVLHPDYIECYAGSDGTAQRYIYNSL
jgi:hypothetical protein